MNWLLAPLHWARHMPGVLWRWLRDRSLLGPTGFASVLTLLGWMLWRAFGRPYVRGDLLAVVWLAVVLFLVFLPRLQAQAIAGPDFLKDRLTFENEARQTLVQLFGGLLLLIGAYTAWTELRTTQASKMTERFTRAVELLGRRDSLESRLGGIYSLEQVARDSDVDYGAIELLATFIRANAPERDAPIVEKCTYPGIRPPADLQAALTVLGRLEPAHAGEREVNLMHTNLHGARINGNFQKARFTNSVLECANARGAHLEGAFFEDTRLQHADLSSAYLDRAALLGTHIEGASLNRASLKGAVLLGAHLEGADLTGAHVEGAKFHPDVLFEGEFSAVHGLTQQQINSACLDLWTILPPNLKIPEPCKP